MHEAKSGFSGDEKPTIAFIGTGVMGRWMAQHLMNAGYPLRVFNRTKSKAARLVEQGAHWCDSPGEAAREAAFIFSIVGYPRDVESIYFDPDKGILSSLQTGAVACDMTTSEPALAEKIAQLASERGGASLDAPVSGGDVGAREAQLSIMVGGDPRAFQQTESLLRVMGSNIVHQGPAGAGQKCKMANQIAIAGGMIGLCESLAYARAGGLDPETVLRSISKGAAGSFSMDKLAPRMLKGDFEAGFYVKHFLKDLRIAVDNASQLDLNLPGLKLAADLYERLSEEMELADQGTQALFRLYLDKLGA
jgi:3-hydroxyisobutyrate dehydrogenase